MLNCFLGSTLPHPHLFLYFMWPDRAQLYVGLSIETGKNAIVKLGGTY